MPQVESAASTESTEPAEPIEEPADTGEFVWERDFRSLGIVGMPGNLASNAAMARNGDEIVLTIDEGHARLLNARHEEKIIEALRNQFGATITLRVEQGDAEAKRRLPGKSASGRRARRQRKTQFAMIPQCSRLLNDSRLGSSKTVSGRRIRQSPAKVCGWSHVVATL